MSTTADAVAVVAITLLVKVGRSEGLIVIGVPDGMTVGVTTLLVRVGRSEGLIVIGVPDGMMVGEVAVGAVNVQAP